jgi:hypothetical protein
MSDLPRRKIEDPEGVVREGSQEGTCPFAGTNRITFDGFTAGNGISGSQQSLPEVFARVC